MKNFFTILRTDFYRAFRSSGFLWGIISTFAIFLFGAIKNIYRDGAVVVDFIYVYRNNITDLLILVATFAYSASFCADCQTRFLYPLTIRSEINTYTLSKSIVTAVMGGLSVATGTLMFILYLCIYEENILPPMYNFDIELSALAFCDLVLAGRTGLFFLCYFYAIFLQAAFWALLGLLISAYLPNKYVAYIGPFILGFGLNEIANVIDLPIWLDPAKLSALMIFRRPASQVIWILTVAFISYIVICTFLFIRKAKRRIDNG